MSKHPIAEHNIIGKTITDTNVSGTYTIDLSPEAGVTPATIWDLTLVGATDFVIANLPTGNDNRIIEILLTGENAWTLAQGTEERSSDAYDGTITNRILIEIANGNAGSEKIFYQIHNL